MLGGSPSTLPGERMLCVLIAEQIRCVFFFYLQELPVKRPASHLVRGTCNIKIKIKKGRERERERRAFICS